MRTLTNKKMEKISIPNKIWKENNKAKKIRINPNNHKT